MKTLSALATAAALMVVAATAQAAPLGRHVHVCRRLFRTNYTLSIVSGAGVQQYGFRVHRARDDDQEHQPLGPERQLHDHEPSCGLERRVGKR